MILLKEPFKEKALLTLHTNDRNAFFTSEQPKNLSCMVLSNVCDALTFLLDNIFIQFGT